MVTRSVASTGTTRAALLACPQLSGLGADALASLAAACGRRSYRAGDPVFLAGDPGDAMFVLERGSVVARTRAVTGEVIDLGVAAQGEAFGYLELVVPGPRTEDAVALRDSTVLVVPGPVALRALRASPDVLWSLLGDVVRIVRLQNRATIDRARPVPQRVAALLLDQPCVGDRVTFDGPQEQLAQRLGIARQTLNAALRDLAVRGLITVHPGGRAVTVDRPGLAAYVELSSRPGGAGPGPGQHGRER